MSEAPDLSEAEAFAAEHALGVLNARERAEAEARMAREPAFAADVEAWRARQASTSAAKAGSRAMRASASARSRAFRTPRACSAAKASASERSGASLMTGGTPSASPVRDGSNS